MNALQIIRSCGSHWVVATTSRCNPREVKIFDSVYESLDTGTLKVVKRLFDDGKELKLPWPVGHLSKKEAPIMKHLP